jgi:hypothetical protein
MKRRCRKRPDSAIVTKATQEEMREGREDNHKKKKGTKHKERIVVNQPGDDELSGEGDIPSPRSYLCNNIRMRSRGICSTAIRMPLTGSAIMG